MSSKCKSRGGRQAFVSILVIIAVISWLFPVNLSSQENRRNPVNPEIEKRQKSQNIEKSEQSEQREQREQREQSKQRDKNIAGKQRKQSEQNKQDEKNLKSKQSKPGQQSKKGGKNIKNINSKKSKKSKKDKKDKKSENIEKGKREIPAEILEIYKLSKPTKEFSIKRNIFSPDTMAPADPLAVPKRFVPPPVPQVKPEEKIEEPDQNIENEVKSSLSYEGYVIKRSKNCALVSVNGEFHAVTIGDLLLEKIKIIKIDKEIITVEVDSHEFEIQIKEDEENEIQ